MPLITKCGRNGSVLLWFTLFLLLTLCGYDQAAAKTFTIGITADIPIFVTAFEGFKEGMAEFGYIEGRDVKYVFHGIPEDNDGIIDAEIKKLLAANVDMLLTVGNHTSLRAKKIIEGTEMPMLMCLTSNSIDEGIVKSFKNPGGNVTGVAVSDSLPKALEWLLTIAPASKKIYVPYDPDDKISVQYLDDVNRFAVQRHIEIIFIKTYSIEEADKAINKLEEGIDAIFYIPSPTLNPGSAELNKAAVQRKIPTGSALMTADPALITFAADIVKAGKQTSRLARLIIQGLKPADIPVETTEAFLTINLKTAEKIGLQIPDAILVRANNIIR